MSWSERDSRPATSKEVFFLNLFIKSRVVVLLVVVGSMGGET